MDNKKLLEYWKNIIGLSDWTIVLRDECPITDFILKDCVGETEWQEVGKCAVIRIISKKDYGERIEQYNFEKTLIHELLHLKFCLLGESGNDLQDRLVHQYIDDFAKMFIKIKEYRNGRD